MPYDPGPDVIEVDAVAAPGQFAGTYRAFGETLRGLKTTFARIVEGPVTIQYPEEKTPVYPRFRGRHKLHRFEDSRPPGLEKCVGCSLCAAACPADCIRVVAAENTPENRISAGERYAAVYEINLSPLHLLRLLRGRVPVRRDHDGARLRAVRLHPLGPDLHEGDAARRGDRAHSAADGGRVARERPMSAVLFFIAAILAIAGAIGVVTLRNPFYSVLALVVHLIALAMLFLLLRAEFVAAAQVVVYAGAVMVLYVFVVAYVGGGEELAAGSALRILGPLFALALAIELCIAMLGSALKGISSEGRAVRRSASARRSTSARCS